MSHDALVPGFQALWPTPLGVHRWSRAEAVNPLLARMCQALRLAQCAARGAAADAAFFASDDDLLQRLRTDEGHALVRFFVESLQDTAGRANAAAWGPAPRPLRVAIEGMWFQHSNHGAFHDVHTHGNCSWSGVYIVQIDEPGARRSHPVLGEANGVTRFHGPRFQALAGAHADLGNAYLLPPHIDIEPVAGQLVLFPSWLAHQALPYAGASDRLIISFNASIHAAAGSDRLHGYSAG